GGEADDSGGAGDDDVSGFEGLAERVEGLAGELRGFVQEQHAAMGQGHGAGPGKAVPAADEGLHGGGVVGCAVGGGADEGVVGPAFLVGFLLGDGFVGEDGDQLAEGADAEDGDAGDERGLAGGLFGDDDLAVSGFGGGEDGGQDAPDGPDASVEAEFADEDEV